MCLKAHERLEDVKLEAVRDNNLQLVTEILDSLNGLKGQDASASELAKILQEPHFQVPYASGPLSTHTRAHTHLFLLLSHSLVE